MLNRHAPPAPLTSRTAWEGRTLHAARPAASQSAASLSLARHKQPVAAPGTRSSNSATMVLLSAQTRKRPNGASAACKRGLVRAGVYTYGLEGSNECPAGSERIVAEEACRAAATTLGRSLGTTVYAFVERDRAYPRGCYSAGASEAYFNTHATGAGSSDSRLLCAVSGVSRRPAPRRKSPCERSC